MDTLVDSLRTVVDDLCAVDLASLTTDQLACSVVGIQREISRLRAVHALAVVEADRASVWLGSGARNISEWLADRTQTSRADAYRQTKLGDTLERSASLAGAVVAGEVSAATADALHATIADPPAGADLDELVEVVKGSGPAAAREAAELWTAMHRTESLEAATARRFAARRVSKGFADDGVVTTTVVLPALQASAFEKACYHASGGFADQDDRSREQLLADGLVNLVTMYASGQVNGGRARPSIVATVPLATLLGDSDEAGRTADGVRVPADVLRELAEQAEVQLLVQAGDEVLWLGRTVRYATDAQYRALLVRDGGCRWPGCNAPPAACEVDHYDEWTIAGGRTDLDRLGLWCPHHHRVRHRAGVELIGTWDDLSIRMPDGQVLPCPRRRTRQAAA